MAVLNRKLQEHCMKKVIIKNCKDRGINPDVILLTEWEDEIDNECEFGENVGEFHKKGILVETRLEMDPYYKSKEALQVELKNCLSCSISHPWYYCCYEDCHGCADYKEGIIEHYQNEHGLLDINIPPKNPHDMPYIILDELIKVSFSKEFIRRKVFTVSNKRLWEVLIEKLGYEKSAKSVPSNQKPRQILEELGLLGEYKYQRKPSIGFDRRSRRIYYINKDMLKRVICDTDYNDLKLKFALSP